MRYLSWLRGSLCALALVACLPGCKKTVSIPEGAVVPAPIILYDGTGSSANDVKAIKALLDREKLPYTTADSDELDVMTPQQLANADLLIMPGGNFEEMGKSLQPDTADHIREAVRGGLNYLGICAGALIAGDSPANGFNLTGARFTFFADSRLGTRKEVVTLANGDGTRFKTYWEDGPELSGWGDPLAKYPDGTPAVVQGKVGSGWVVLAGVHLEAPESWYAGLEPGGQADSHPAAVSNARAAKLIRAAFNGEALPYL